MRKMKLIFCLLLTVKGLKVILSFLVCVIRHARITQNNKFAIFMQYPKKEVSNKVKFLLADKYEGLLQIDTKVMK